MRADLHVHSGFGAAGDPCASRRGRRGCEPEAMVRAAWRRGMDLATLTDRDTIEGCLRYLDRHPVDARFIISMETWALDPPSGTRVPVLLFGLDETGAAEALRLREDIEALLHWARGASIAAALAPSPHLLGADGGTVELRRILERFECIETGGAAWGADWCDVVDRIAQDARNGRPPDRIGGSSARAPRGVGTGYTAARATGVAGFLSELRAGRTWSGFAPRGARSPVDRLKGLRRLPVMALLGREGPGSEWHRRLRRARRGLDGHVVRQFQERARAFATGPGRADPGADGGASAGH
ncbi:MAG: PHP domain-containing protein [Candidatus Polarisedimenticolia bacterium]